MGVGGVTHMVWVMKVTQGMICAAWCFSAVAGTLGSLGEQEMSQVSYGCNTQGHMHLACISFKWKLRPVSV